MGINVDNPIGRVATMMSAGCLRISIIEAWMMVKLLGEILLSELFRLCIGRRMGSRVEEEWGNKITVKEIRGDDIFKIGR